MSARTSPMDGGPVTLCLRAFKRRVRKLSFPICPDRRARAEPGRPSLSAERRERYRPQTASVGGEKQSPVGRRVEICGDGVREADADTLPRAPGQTRGEHAD